MNLTRIHPNLSAIKMDGTYLKNFNLALINWELNSQEDRKRPPIKKERKVFR
jgi:hypothetical protein